MTDTGSSGRSMPIGIQKRMRSRLGVIVKLSLAISVIACQASAECAGGSKSPPHKSEFVFDASGNPVDIVGGCADSVGRPETSGPVAESSAVPANVKADPSVSRITGLPKSERVSGYVRRDGTIVAPYYRSHR